MFEMSKHSIRTGRLSRLSTSRSSSSAAIRFDRAASRIAASDFERELRVLGRELDETSLLAAQRRAHDDARAAPGAQELGERRGVAHSRRDQHLRRSARRRAVVLEDERLEDRLRVLARDVLEVEPVAVDHLPVAQRKDLHGGLVAVDREADDVDRPDVAPVRRLPVGEVTDREEPVPVARGLLEALVGRGLAHALRELGLDRLRVAGEKVRRRRR